MSRLRTVVHLAHSVGLRISFRSQPRRNPIVQEYILPDFGTRMKGYIYSGPNAQPLITSKPPSSDSSHMDLDGTEPRPSKSRENGPEPVLYMGNERFTVPEVLFHPRDVGESSVFVEDNLFHLRIQGQALTRRVYRKL